MAGFFLLSVLPGSMSSFYGDEIGMQDSFDLDTSKVYQGGQLAPMQWTSHPYANFTSENSIPWLPLHPSYITLNVESQTKKLSLFGQLMELKNRGDPLVPSQTTPSLMHSLVVRLSNLYEETSPQYMWFHNSCGLVVAKITHSSAVFVLIANYGSDVQFITEDVQCGDKSVSSFLTSSYLSKRVDVLLSTNSSFIGQIELHHLQLEPGDAIIGRFIT
ncbi:putative maltase D, partial [Stegodyphus mimosarum]